MSDAREQPALVRDTLRGRPRTRRLRTVLAALLRDRFAMVALVVFLLLVAYALLVPWFAAEEATRIDPTRRLESPGLLSSEPGLSSLGTDHLGRELHVMVAEGLRTSLGIGFVVVLLTATLGSLVGASGGYLGGRIDDGVGRVMDTVNVFPGLLLAIAVVSAVGGGLGVIIVVLSLEGWVVYGRLGRSLALSERHAEYILAARVSGSGPLRILVGHIGRTSTPAILALALVQLPNVILQEATLSFVGFGIQPPNTSLGLIVAEERGFLLVQPWPVLYAGGILAVTCISLALIGLSARKAIQR